MRKTADLVFTPTPAGWSVRSWDARPPTTDPLGSFRPAGLTSRPHYDHRRFGRLTWIALPATGIDFQPQTRPFALQQHYSIIWYKKQAQNNIFFTLAKPHLTHALSLFILHNVCHRFQIPYFQPRTNVPHRRQSRRRQLPLHKARVRKN